MLRSVPDAPAAACRAGSTVRRASCGVKRCRRMVADESAPSVKRKVAKSLYPRMGTPPYSCMNTSVVCSPLCCTA